MKLLHIIGARPQFIKYFPIQQAIDRIRSRTESKQDGLHEARPDPPGAIPLTHEPPPLTSLLVHTGQHYDYRMSQIFFDELGNPAKQIGWVCECGGRLDDTSTCVECKKTLEYKSLTTISE